MPSRTASAAGDTPVREPPMDRRAEEFVSFASHDLQEPLRMVRGYVTLLSRRPPVASDPVSSEMALHALDGLGRMERMVLDLLDYSRLKPGGASAARCDAGDALAAALDTLRLTIDETGARIDAGRLPVVAAEQGLVLRVFQNLVGNALKFRSHAAPRVEVGARPHGDAWLFWVRDNGIGIDPKAAEDLFRPFRRLHSQDRYSGTGMGLATCRKIVEMMGGRIWVESAAGRGATFWFTLPRGD